jgi:plastocyanin
MQFKDLALVASAFVFAACGGGESKPAAETTPAPAAEMAAPAPAATGAVTMAPATGTTHEIKMLGDDKGFRFEPANLTIKTGDAVKFVFVSGGPHNVAFDGATLAANVKAQLDANFGSERMAELSSNMYMAVGQGVTVSFANIAAGSYPYNCTPHLAMGMKGVITVQ